MIRVFLVDDQSIIRQGLTALLELEADIQVVGDAEDGAAALAQLQMLQGTEQLPQVVLMDLRMPVMDGIAATQAIHQAYADLKVLVLTTFDEDDLVAQALQVGASGYLLKDTPSEELAMAIRAVAKGYSQFGPGIVQKLTIAPPVDPDQAPPGFWTLTPREQQVLKLIGQGASNREIAQALYLSEGTVKNHVTHLLSRLNLRDRTQAAVLAVKLRSHLNRLPLENPEP
jgi:DNA-binding NarL/FixJ family response regulator